MHLTLEREATKPASTNVRSSKAGCDAFLDRYNQDRPHQALGMNVPADVPFHEHTITVTHCGRICFKGRKINLSHVFAGRTSG